MQQVYEDDDRKNSGQRQRNKWRCRFSLLERHLVMKWGSEWVYHKLSRNQVMLPSAIQDHEEWAKNKIWLDM